MTAALIMPRLSEACGTGTILKGLGEPAASLEAGKSVVQIESDKAVVELESPNAGHIQSITFALGDIAEAGMASAAIAGPEETLGGQDPRHQAPQTSTQVAGGLPALHLPSHLHPAGRAGWPSASGAQGRADGTRRDSTAGPLQNP